MTPSTDTRVSAATPGPWEVKPAEPDKPHMRVRGTRLGEKYRIANALGGETEFEMQEAEANARLIAAAPELYEIAALIADLEASAEHLPEPMSSNLLGIVDQAKSALTKARAASS